MKMILSDKSGNIEVGDIIEHIDYGICLFAYDEESQDEFRYKLVSIETGNVLNAYKEIKPVLEMFRLLIKNVDLVISDFEGEE